MIELSEKKIRRLRFDNLSGDTPLRRLTVLLRCRNIRNLTLLMALMLSYCAEVLILLYIDRLYGEAMDGLLFALMMFSFMSSIYLPVLFWLILLVLRPDKSYGMRRLRRLGNLEKLAGELEEDLAAEGACCFKKAACALQSGLS